MKRRKRLMFLGWFALIFLFWGGVLPWLGDRDWVRARIDRQNRAGIDPSAMFYTELGTVSGVRLRNQGGSWVAEGFQLGR